MGPFITLPSLPPTPSGCSNLLLYSTSTYFSPLLVFSLFQSHLRCHSCFLPFFTHSRPAVFHDLKCFLCGCPIFFSVEVSDLVREHHLPMRSPRTCDQIQFLVHLCLIPPARDAVPAGMPDPSLFPLTVALSRGAFGQSFHVSAYCTALDRLSPHHTGNPPASVSRLQAFNPDYFFTTHDKHMM